MAEQGLASGFIYRTIVQAQCARRTSSQIEQNQFQLLKSELKSYDGAQPYETRPSEIISSNVVVSGSVPKAKPHALPSLDSQNV